MPISRMLMHRQTANAANVCCVRAKNMLFSTLFLTVLLMIIPTTLLPVWSSTTTKTCPVTLQNPLEMGVISKLWWWAQCPGKKDMPGPQGGSMCLAYSRQAEILGCSPTTAHALMPHSLANLATCIAIGPLSVIKWTGRWTAIPHGCCNVRLTAMPRWPRMIKPFC